MDGLRLLAVISGSIWPLLLLSLSLLQEPGARLLLPFTAGCLLQASAVEVWDRGSGHRRLWLLLAAQALGYGLQPWGSLLELALLLGLLCLTRLASRRLNEAVNGVPSRQLWLQAMEATLTLPALCLSTETRLALMAGFASSHAYCVLPPGGGGFLMHDQGRFLLVGFAGHLVAVQVLFGLISYLIVCHFSTTNEASIYSTYLVMALQFLCYTWRQLCSLLFVVVAAAEAEGSEEAGRLAPGVLARLHRCRARGLSDGRCAICLETAAAVVLSLPCSHAFHARCLEAWLARADTCPVCVTPVQLPEPACRACDTARRSRRSRHSPRSFLRYYP